MSHRLLIVLLQMLLLSAAAGATGVLEYNPPAAEATDGGEESTATDAAASGDPADGGECPCSEDSGPAAPAFVPTVTYPDTLFMPMDSRMLADIDLAVFLGAIESDRRLLSELRKPIPENREDAIVFLRRLKRLAEISDPTRLAMAANRVLEQAPIYFDWLETEFESEQDEVYEYYIGGAQGFSRALEEFQNAVLLTVINRLDTASRIIQESNSASE